MLIPVILAGGSGTRLWPLSRSLYPKQLIELTSDKTMLQETVLRLDHIENTGPPILICNENHRFMVAEQLREIGIKNYIIILEPVGKNTAPAVATAALKSVAEYEDPYLLVLPADHYIGDNDGFMNSIKKACKFAENDKILTFGIVPQSPETGYGYIKKGNNINGNIYEIEKFVEKPDLETAKKYFSSDNYLWNSGMFLFRSKSMIKEFETYSKNILDCCKKALDKGKTDLDFIRLDRESFEKSPEDSLDYAIMENTKKGAVVPLSCKWNDLGSWEALWQTKEKDENNNVIVGDIYTSNVKNSYLHSTSRIVAAVGVENHVII